MLILKFNLPNCESFYAMVWVFPELLIGSDCGLRNLQSLKPNCLFVKGDAAAAG